MNNIDTTPITVTLPWAVWQAIIHHVQIGAYEDVAHLMSALGDQIVPQLNAAAAAEAKLTTANANAEKATQPPVLN